MCFFRRKASFEYGNTLCRYGTRDFDGMKFEYLGYGLSSTFSNLTPFRKSHFAPSELLRSRPGLRERERNRVQDSFRELKFHFVLDFFFVNGCPPWLNVADRTSRTLRLDCWFCGTVFRIRGCALPVKKKCAQPEGSCGSRRLQKSGLGPWIYPGG